MPKLKNPLTLGYQAIPKIQIITNIKKRSLSVSLVWVSGYCTLNTNIITVRSVRGVRIVRIVRNVRIGFLGFLSFLFLVFLVL